MKKGDKRILLDLNDCECLHEALLTVSRVRPVYEATTQYFAFADYSKIRTLEEYQLAQHHQMRALEMLGHVQKWRQLLQLHQGMLTNYWKLVLQTTREVTPGAIDRLLKEMSLVIQPYLPPELYQELASRLLSAAPEKD